MQLLQIQRSRSSDKVWLSFDDGSYIPFKIDDVVLEKLKINTEVDYPHLCGLSLKFLINNYALRQVAISPKIETILAPKLKNQARYYQKKYSFPSLNSDEIVDSTISYLNEKGWLDPVGYAKNLIKKHHKKSKRYLEQLFSFYHLDKSLLNSSDDLDNMKKILLKKINHLSKPLDFKTKSKLIQSLVQKGFAYSDTKSVIDELLSVR